MQCSTDAHSVAGWQCVGTQSCHQAVVRLCTLALRLAGSVEHSGLRSQRIVTCQQPIQMNGLSVALLAVQRWGRGRVYVVRAKSGAVLNVAAADQGTWLHERPGAAG